MYQCLHTMQFTPENTRATGDREFSEGAEGNEESFTVMPRWETQ